MCVLGVPCTVLGCMMRKQECHDRCQACLLSPPYYPTHATTIELHGPAPSLTQTGFLSPSPAILYYIVRSRYYYCYYETDTPFHGSPPASHISVECLPGMYVPTLWIEEPGEVPPLQHGHPALVSNTVTVHACAAVHHRYAVHWSKCCRADREETLKRRQATVCVTSSPRIQIAYRPDAVGRCVSSAQQPPSLQLVYCTILPVYLQLTSNRPALNTEMGTSAAGQQSGAFVCKY